MKGTWKDARLGAFHTCVTLHELVSAPKCTRPVTALHPSRRSHATHSCLCSPQTEAAADGRPLRQRTGTDVGAMFQQQAAAATAAHWQIVSIAPTAQPGEGRW